MAWLCVKSLEQEVADLNSISAVISPSPLVLLVVSRMSVIIWMRERWTQRVQVCTRYTTHDSWNSRCPGKIDSSSTTWRDWFGPQVVLPWLSSEKSTHVLLWGKNPTWGNEVIMPKRYSNRHFSKSTTTVDTTVRTFVVGRRCVVSDSVKKVYLLHLSDSVSIVC